jgi:Arc/MetJ-type ribon-helix-helix transcriptional regulator
MSKPFETNAVTVRLSAEDAADLQERVNRGEFASLEEGVAAELAELNYRRAADLVGGSEELEALLDELIDDEIDPAEKVAGNISLTEMLEDLKAQAKAADE